VFAPSLMFSEAVLSAFCSCGSSLALSALFANTLSTLGWPEAPTSVPEHVVFQCSNGVVLGLFSEVVF